MAQRTTASPRHLQPSTEVSASLVPLEDGPSSHANSHADDNHGQLQVDCSQAAPPGPLLPQKPRRKPPCHPRPHLDRVEMAGARLPAHTYLQQVNSNHVDEAEAQRHQPSHGGVRCGLV